jgi:hypothetical protein
MMNSRCVDSEAAKWAWMADGHKTLPRITHKTGQIIDLLVWSMRARGMGYTRIKSIPLNPPQLQALNLG